VWKPILLGGLFRAVRGDDGPMASLPASRARMNLLDLHRWAEHLRVPFAMPASHPQRSVLAMRAILASGDLPRAAKALYRAYWVDGLDVPEPAVVARVLDAAGFDGAAVVARAGEPSVKDELFARTNEAIEAGAFGVPTFVVHRPGREPEFEFGQDRIEHVAELLREVASEPPTLTFLFDYSSPFAYLGATQVEPVAARHGARVVWRPFLLGGLFRSIGTPDVPLFAMPPAKQRFMNDDMHRWAQRRGVPLRFPSRFPMNTVTALRMTLQVPDAARTPLVHALFRALWVDDRDLADPAELSAIASSVGLDGEALVRGAAQADVKESLRRATEQAEALGVCGAPCFLVQTATNREGTLFWGQDRLELVERALDGWRPKSG
jgi:2-hydroxychromene-2-carboxylate isomerase